LQGIQRLEKLRHDLRTFLNHIIGYSDIIRTDLHEYSRHKYIPAINQITKKAEKIKRLINFYFDTQTDFQDLATLDDIKKAFYVPLVQIISDSRRLMVTFRRDDPRFASDAEQLLSVANSMLEIIEAEVADLQIEDISTKQIEQQSDINGESIEADLPLPQYTDQDYLDEFGGDKAKNPGKILIVDDEATNRELLGRFLIAIGHEVVTFESGKLALEYLENETCDMVMLDVMMPEMTGFQVLRKLKQNPKTRSIPVFMISAMEDSESVAQCIKAGAEDYLSKDYEPPILKARIDACFDRGHLQKQQGVYIEALLKSQQALSKELSDAGNYITSLLPKPLHGRISTGISFIPSAQLGGDFPGYHWIDETHLAIYLVDVSGHGIRSALLAVSIANLLRNQGIPHTCLKA
jgi:sigma-B regulation protein RsbU (phosphoserine phosphatase)